jgi:NAD-dependent DNA ligase
MAKAELERHRKLVEEIRAHDHRYYVLDDPQISCASWKIDIRSCARPIRRLSASAARRAVSCARCRTSCR